MYSGPITIADGATFRLDSFGNGAAYTLFSKQFIDRPDTWTSVWFDGDDAVTLRDELDAIEGAFPRDSRDMTLSRLAEPYAELFELA